MTELMHRFGRTVRREDPAAALFEPGSDRSWLDRHMIDEEPAPAPAPDHRTPLQFVRRTTLLSAIAAIVLVLVGVSWWLLPDLEPAPSLGDLRLSRTAGVLRGDEAPQFRSGEQVWLHMDGGPSGFAYVALLDEGGALSAITGEPLALSDGAEVVGPLVLDEQTGTASLIVLATAERRSASWLAGALERAARAEGAGSGDHAAQLAAIVNALRSDPEVTVEALTYRHVP